MKLRKLAIAVAAVSALAAPLIADAQVNINVQIPGLVTVAPPPPRYEPLPPPRGGEAWVPGHWQWNDRNYAWRPGYWQAARPDAVYAPGRWVQADGGWRWVDGDWRRRDREERHREDRHREDRYRHDGDERRGDGGFCPPGQAKKGRC